jgi:AcrR family transcriptional regulator
MARKYKLKRRAERQQETRRRIVEAAVELHTTLGPARTTMLAIAKGAGVERPTLYRHFPTSKDLFSACSSHHWSQNPPPNPEPWLKIADPEARLRYGLTELYEYYSRHEQGMWKILRDLEDMPELRPFAANRIAHRERVRQVLVSAWLDCSQRRKLQRRKLLIVAVGHAVDFFAWRSLRRQQLSNEVAVEMMISAVRSIVARRIPKPG